MQWHVPDAKLPIFAPFSGGLRNGFGSKSNRRGYAGFGPCFHLPGFHFGTGCLSNSQMGVSGFESVSFLGWDTEGNATSCLEDSHCHKPEGVRLPQDKHGVVSAGRMQKCRTRRLKWCWAEWGLRQILNTSGYDTELLIENLSFGGSGVAEHRDAVVYIAVCLCVFGEPFCGWFQREASHDTNVLRGSLTKRRTQYGALTIALRPAGH